MFSKKPAQHSQVAAPHRAAASTLTVIGPDVVIRGNIEAVGDLQVEGRVVGNIGCASLMMSEGSSVEGEILAESARIAGNVSGTVCVRDLVVLRGARVEGDVSYETISIEQGAAVNGRFAPRSAGLAPATMSAPIINRSTDALIEDAEFTAAG